MKSFVSLLFGALLTAPIVFAVATPASLTAWPLCCKYGLGVATLTATGPCDAATSAAGCYTACDLYCAGTAKSNCYSACHDKWGV